MVDLWDDYVMSTTDISEAEMEATYPDMSDLIRLLLTRKGQQSYITGQATLLNYRLLKRPIVFETKFGTVVYADKLKSVSIVQNAVQLVGDFYQLKRYRSRGAEDVIIKAVENKPLHRSLSVNLAYMKKQFPHFDTLLATFNALDLTIDDVAEQLFNAESQLVNHHTALPDDIALT